MLRRAEIDFNYYWRARGATDIVSILRHRDFIMSSDQLIWLDEVRAIPAIGIRSQGNFSSAAALLESIRPVLAEWQAQAKHFTINLQNPLSVHVEDSDGFLYEIGGDNVVTQFRYRTNLIEKGQQLAVLKFESERRSYSELLEKVKNNTLQFYRQVLSAERRYVGRVGVVAIGNFDYELPPPGFSEYMKYLSAPWGKPIQEAKTQVVTNLFSDEIRSENCIHVIEWNAAQEESVVRFVLDWQRNWSNPFEVKDDEIEEVVSDAIKQAVLYFEKFGLGDLNYGHDL